MLYMPPRSKKNKIPKTMPKASVYVMPGRKSRRKGNVVRKGNIVNTLLLTCLNK